MTRLVVEVEAALAQEVDALIERGVVTSRTDAVRQGLRLLVHRYNRERIAQEIVSGYTRIPQAGGEIAWVDASTRAMIGDEPW